MSARRTPSNAAPSRSMARRDLAFRSSVLRHTRCTAQTSKAWVSRRYFASVLHRVRWAEGGEPGGADLHRVRGVGSLERRAGRPAPLLDVEVARGPDDAVVPLDRERHATA